MPSGERRGSSLRIASVTPLRAWWHLLQRRLADALAPVAGETDRPWAVVVDEHAALVGEAADLVHSEEGIHIPVPAGVQGRRIDSGADRASLDLRRRVVGHLMVTVGDFQQDAVGRGVRQRSVVMLLA